MTGRDLDPGIALSVACGQVLIGRPQDADRDRLAKAVTAVPERPGPARGLAQVAAAWLAGDMDDHALRVALRGFNAPFCERTAGRPYGLPLFAASTHAAHSADAMEDAP